jgi:hypothetical protein
MPVSLNRSQFICPKDRTQSTGITLERAASDFVRDGSEPRVMTEGKWWRLNPNRPDFRPRADSKLLANRGDAKNMPERDFSGSNRSRVSMGAYAAAASETR